MNIAFDLDGVICHRKSELGGSEKYLTCYPDLDVIDVVNALFDEGNYIIGPEANEDSLLGWWSFDGNCIASLT